MLCEIVKARVHWLPYFIPSGEVEKLLGEYGRIETITMENSISDGLKHCKSLVNGVIMEVKSKEDVPHFIHIPFRGAVYEALVTIPGREPVCLRCKRKGHVRRQCTAKWCNKCKDFIGQF